VNDGGGEPRFDPDIVLLIGDVACGGGDSKVFILKTLYKEDDLSIY
jgi:hypothetical protein